MKKFLISLLILAFFVPFFAFSAESNLEKISSPEQIPHFKLIKKEGNSLYGVRIQKSEDKPEATTTKAEVSKPEPVKEAKTINLELKKLEKISGPWDLNLFEKIKKVGNALWGYKKESSDDLGATKLTAEVITCLKTAIDKKDGVVKTTITTASSELVKAVDNRNTCQKAALDLVTNQEIIKAFKVCKETFNKAVKETRLTAKQTRDAAWKVYQQEVKACHKPVVSATSTSSVKESGQGSSGIFLDDGGENLDL